jgi:drug/metabolite transporter (DMT)-like permease
MPRVAEAAFAKQEVNLLRILLWYEDGRWLAVLSAAAFSLKAIFVKLAYQAYPVDAVTLLTLRMVIALPAFLWLCRGVVTAGFDRKIWCGLLVLAFCGYYLSSLADFIGLHYVSAGLERLILFTYPAPVVLFEAWWRKRPVSSRLMAGIGLAYIGIGITFQHDLSLPGDPQAVVIGAAWILLSSLTYAGYYLGSAMLIGRVGAEKLAGIAGSVATLFILFHFAATHPINSLTSLPAPVWGWSAAMAVVSTALPIWLAAMAVARMGAGRTAAIGALGPALTIVLGWIVLGEPVSVAQITGILLVLGGVSWVGRAKSRAG